MTQLTEAFFTALSSLRLSIRYGSLFPTLLTWPYHVLDYWMNSWLLETQMPEGQQAVNFTQLLSSRVVKCN